MKALNRVLVGLDLSELDSVIISYVSMLDKLLQFDKVYFFHVSPSLSIPKELLEKHPYLLAPADESVEEIIKDKLNQYYEGNARKEIMVLEGNPKDKILRWSDIKEIDLIAVGKKETLKGSGVLPNYLSKVAHCSLIMIPEKSKSDLSMIMTSIDFSFSSKKAVEASLELKKSSDSNLLVQHIYQVPHGYHKSGKSFEEFADIMRTHATNDAEKFMGSLGVSDNDYTMLFSLGKDRDLSNTIYEEAVRQGADLIVLSSKGRTNLSNILLGSIAEKVLRIEGNIPVLVIKSKKENMGVLDAILNI